MAKKICKCCGKEFEGKGTSAYCSGYHYFKCEVCGKMFDADPRNPPRTCSKECKSKLSMKSKCDKIKICEYCGKEFHMKNSSSRYCDGPHYTKCVICGKQIEFACSPNEKPQTCSKECQQELRKRTSLEKYGVTNPAKSVEVRKKISDVNSSDKVKSKREATCLENYGVKNVSQNTDIRKKLSEVMKTDKYLRGREATCMRVYGTLSPMQSDQVKEHVKHTNQLRYGVDWATQSEKWKSSKIATNLEKYGVPHYCMTDECKALNGHTISETNKRVASMLESCGLSVELDKVRLQHKSYDLHIVGTNILIEIDPTYTHNAVGNHWGEGLKRDYHLEKSKIAQENGYRCVHLFDWDDIDKVISMLSPCETLYARKCEVIQIDVNTVNQFESNYHLQGKCNGQKVCYGLYYEGDLVEVMTFGRPRYNKKYQWELLRLCTKTGYKITGGASKLFKHFLSDYNPISIISYCDRSKFSGHVYENIGMKLHHTTDPAKIWSKESNRITNNLLLQRGYDQLFKANYGKGTSNEELMLKDGWLPVYDCGQGVYDWRLLS